MAKRFTDTEKWKNPWFRALPVEAKAAWCYLLDNCDHAGVWHADFELMSFMIGKTIVPQRFQEWFCEKVRKVEKSKYIVDSFIEFQYGELNPNNNTHRSVLNILKKLAPQEPLGSPSQGAQDTGSDKGSDKDKEASEKLFEELWYQYPNKDGRKAAHSRFVASVKTEKDEKDIRDALRNYLSSDRVKKGFIKNGSTWFNNWRDWIAPAEPPSSARPPMKYIPNPEPKESTNAVSAGQQGPPEPGGDDEWPDGI